MECVSSQKPSFQYLYDDASIQIRTSPIDNYFTSHVCGFCATFIGLTVRQPTRTSSYSRSFPAGTSVATQNYAQVGSSCCTFIFIETAVRIRVRHSRGILGWRHFPKMADHENCIPASVDICSLEGQHQGYHEKSYEPIDPGDSQGSLHTSWSRLWLSYGTWGQSTVCQLHGRTTVALPDILSVAFWRSSGVF